MRSGSATVLADTDGRGLLPSVVRYTEDGQTVVGHEAQKEQSRDPHNTIVSVKRFMGRGLTDIQDAGSLPYRFVDAPGMVQLVTRAGVKSPVEVSADILRVLQQRAQAALGGELTGAVITVPAYFDDAQRQATKDAAQLAGLHVLRLLNEPTAAAIAYGLDNSSEGTYVVYDLGGGTFDVSILKLTRGVFEVMATSGDSALGGDDFDHRVYCWILEQVGLSGLNAQDSRLLLTCARQAKEALTDHAESQITALLSDGQAIDLTLDQNTFRQITKTLVDKTLTPVRKALRDARHPARRRQRRGHGGRRHAHATRTKSGGGVFRPTSAHQSRPGQGGCAGSSDPGQCAGLSNKGDDEWLLLDVIPLSLGIETMGGLTEKIIPRNSTIPIARAQDFTTFKDGQTAMSIHVLQGERELVSDCRSLAKFVLRGIPPMVAGAARIRITFQVDADGLLAVSARELTSGVEASIEVKPSYGLTDDEISRMLTESLDHVQDDIEARKLREAIVDAESLVAATRAALQADGELLADDERLGVDNAIAQVEQAIASRVTRQVNAAASQLNHATETFAARRMDRNIQRALKGQNIAEL
ncbi:Fe-S protein assembly chaperone HscA [Paludibacterium denitrificans]|uniref:Fe-S protein assembly chaperone HscA n=1 Tax=Paludibacterium denitrificans TaxID=2675226 RepID=UPI001E3EC304|nr:Fe-S protein assembly chaperone HscA [Paludibacterium denitrificans]